MKAAFTKFFTFLAIILIFNSCSEDIDPLLGRDGALYGVGQFGNQLLSANRFSRLEIEVLYMEGYRPTTQMINGMQEFLEPLVNKPGGIQVIDREIPAKGQDTYTINNIRDLEREHRTLYNQGNTVTIFVMVLDGNFSRDEEETFTIGIAYQNTSMALFGPRIHMNTGGFRRPSRGLLETTVALHELGHLLGLVNNGTAMVHDHEDEEQEKHCDNEECLMFWQVETSGLFGFLGNTIPQLDENCLKDLRANGGR
ncbi:hypothetical protein [Pleomorphovibrio marinus]|uniref:hypothetical protein n=1 Tax=Pleomorphovibrio marinus TaxID=2164132 RepID=UPI000E0A98DB|nr:hypothetical protein [Pleomorphovibrio marinus]